MFNFKIKYVKYTIRFELAKKGARIEPKAEGNSINLANKFTALSSNN